MGRNKSFIVGAVAGVGLAGAAAAAVGLGLPQASAQASRSAPPAVLTPASTAPNFVAAPGGPVSFADIFEKVSPAVVSIVVTTKVSPSELSAMQGIPFPFNQLPQFQGRGGQGGSNGRGVTPNRPRTTPKDAQPGGQAPDGADGDGEDGPEAQAAGSGFFISSSGYIVTNNHVVENATKITVTLTDKRELDATVVGRDEATDLAVIKVQGDAFPYVTFETQAKPRVGDWVLAVGNPLQLGGTATAGIVSYVGRDLHDASSNFVDYLQIDAPINRGNSGGPTFDTYGRVIGVNTAIYSQTGGSIGIGFAVPADVADGIVRQLVSGKVIQRGYMGATIQGVPKESAEALGIPVNTGATITDLVPGGPGDKAGLKPGDLVLTINGTKVVSASGLTRAVSQTHAGDTFRLGVRRNGRDITIEVRAGVRPSETQLNATLNGQGGDDQEGAPPGASRPEAQRQVILGMSLGPLTAAARQANGVEAGVQGVLIQDVQANSDAFKKGLRHGDVIVQANQSPVSTVADVAAAAVAARRAGRPAIFLLVNHAGRNQGVPVKLDAVGK